MRLGDIVEISTIIVLIIAVCIFVSYVDITEGM